MTHSSIIAKIIYILFFIGIVNPIFSQAPEEPVYYEGEIYQSQIIGSQCWMTENLNVGSFIQGTTLLTNNGIVEKYCYDNSIANCDSFGGLYPWNELMNYLSVEGSQGICPIGWHIPTKIDWNTLIGQYPFLSSSDSLVWTGNSGFDALLGGYSNGNGGFSQLGIIGAYYSSNSYNGNNNRRVFPGSGRVLREGCSASDAYSVRCIRNNIYNTVPFALTLSSQSVSCNGGNDGTIFMSLAGVSNPSFIWSNGATTEDLYNVSAGTYSVTVTEGSNTLSETIVVGEASDIVPVLSITSQIGCYNESDGSLNVTCTGGTPPYSYVWSTNNVTPNLTNIPAGTYFVTIFDNNNCQTIGEIAILNPTLFVDFSSIVTMPSCNGNNDGAIDIIPDVAGFYTYSWSNFQAVEDISGLFAGNFGITVTDTLTNYCTVDNFEIISPDPISIVDVITNTSDVGLSDASINISVSGGTSPYNYSWSNGASTEDISNIPAGSYLVTIVDANNCTFTSDALLVTEPGITAGIPTITNVSCYGSQNGAISVTATSGCSGWGCISYSIVTGVTQSYGGFWNLSAGTYNMTITDNIGGLVVVENIIVTEPDQIEIISFVEETGCSGANITVNASGGTGTLEYSINGVDYFISNVFSDVPAGTTTFFVRDSVYCDTSENYVVSPVDLMSVSGVTTDASCFGNSDGSIQLSVINGVSPFTYTWSNGLTGNYIYNLPAGNYTVTVTDANSCSETATFYIDEPDLLLISLTGTDVTYPQGINGTISTSIAGGFTPFSFNWSNGSTQQNLTNISEGNYTLTVQDCQLCSATASIQISENLLPVSININSSDVSCYGGNNGAAYANASGGNAPYSFLWSNGATTQNILNLVAGTYTLTVTGFYGMTGTTSVIIYEPSEVSGNITIISNYNSYDVSCSQCTDGQINVSAQGGTSPYTYNWSNGGTNANQNNLGAGNYSVTITDIAGCEDIKSVSLNEPDELQLAVQVISNFSGYNVSCPGGNNGIATGNVTGGVSPYSYLWSSGANTAVATGLASQTYSLTVTDVYGIEASGYVSLTAPLALSIQINPINNLCNGNSNGLLSIAVNGGITPYTYNWSNGATDNVAVNLAAGYYTLTVTDSHNCQSTSSSFISQPSIINIAPAITNISCFGDNNGAIDITVTGGVNPYTFLWSTNSSFEDITNLSSGAYSIAVTDFNGCTQIHDNIVIGQPSEINTNITVTQPSDYGIADGAIAMTVSGGVSPYSFLWSNGATTQSISGLLPGTFNVTIVDSENCTKNESVVVSLPSGLYFTATINHVSCFGFSNGEINITVNSGVSPYSYFWSNGGTTNQITELATGEYFITIIDSNNNTNTDSYLVTEPDDLNINFISSDVSCFGDSDGSIEALVTGGTEP
ncbi:MAG: FISUMP domain-containing protein, partial [Bacteroidota bacterium]|nr:FISUMP domain-containing protein [Bacteroidota bacterium]